MPPKRVAKPKLHQLAVELPQKTIISDLTTKKQYCVGKQFATGGFGRIYTCNEVGSKTELVVKVEPYGNGPLFTEMNVFIRILKKDQIAQFMRDRKLKRLGVPPMISGGIHQFGDEKLRFLVIPKYATSLEAIREKRKTFTQNEVWTIARCMLESLEYIHEKNYTHADIKAANILLEKPDDFSTSVLVDYGLARMSVNNEDKPDKKRAHNGTAIFTSCDAHRGNHPSYRGDLEILAYNMVYWLSGSLPWEAQESSPEKVFQQKEVFLKELSSSLKSCLKDCSESISPLYEVFAIARKTGYAEQLDFPKLYKIVDSVLKKSRAVKRKSPAEDVAVEVEVKKPALAKRDRAASFESSSKADTKSKRTDAVESSSKADLKSKRADAVESSSKADAKPKRADAAESSSKADVKPKRADAAESSSKTDLKPKRADAVAPPSSSQSPREEVMPSVNGSSQRIRLRLKTATKSDSKEAEWSPSPRATKTARSLRRSSPAVSPQQAHQSPSPATRQTARKRIHLKAGVKSPRLPAGAVVPGLSVRRVPCSPLNVHSPPSKEALNPRTPEETSARLAAGVSSSQKRSPTRLKMIPGMNNFARGRRSIIVDQISKKYKRIADKKKRLS